MLWTKFKYENKQRAITQKRMGEAARPPGRPPARPPANGDNIIRPVFDGRIKTQPSASLSNDS